MLQRYLRVLLAALVGLLLMSGCGSATSPAPADPNADLNLTSRGFAEGDSIPRQYTCDGEDISPPLSWGEPPEGTESFVLIMDDPDAPVGTWVHWVVFNVPAERRSLPEDVPAQDQLPEGGLQGDNGWKQIGYGGPCPPSGSTHRYVFKLYALDTTLDLEPGARKSPVIDRMEGHVLAASELTGEYARE